MKVTQLDAELGHVGLAQPGSPALINTLLAGGYLPVVSSIGVTDDAKVPMDRFHGKKLIECPVSDGISKAEQLIEQGIITDGMIVKVNAALDAARALGRPVDIASWRHAEQLPALFNGTPIGTRILA